MSISLRLHLHDATITEEASTCVVLTTHQTRLTFSDLAPSLREALLLLANQGVDEVAWQQQVSSEHFSHKLQWQRLLQRLTDIGLIERSLQMDSEAIATLIPIAPYYRLHTRLFDTSAVLSRFAYCHRVQQDMILESPLSHAYIVLHGWRALAMVSALSKPTEAVEFIADDLMSAFRGLLGDANFLTAADDETTKEDSDPDLRGWAFHDLLFHSRARRGRHGPSGLEADRSGGPLLPVVKPPMSTSIVPLPYPDLDQLKQSDVPFTAVLEKRRSIRSYGQSIITRDQLGEFLYRSARIQRTVQGDWYEGSLRVTPGAGAIHELELYVIVAQCLELSGGIYHYNPQQHHLEAMVADQESIGELIGNAANLTGERGMMPQLLIIIAARLQRISAKYDATALSLILKDVGALMQTMYLVATAMGLAPCAIGEGDADLFSKALSMNYYGETSVGEFLLGTA